jgi:phytoene dehydrogenase-like protein
MFLEDDPLSTFDTDVVIIGAGLGGLTSAILLGQLGRKVTVIERSTFPGGLLRSYTRQGIDCAVGLHYFGLAGEGDLLRQIFDILGVTDQLQLRRLGAGGILERYIFDDFTFDLPSTVSAFEQALISICPDDARAIHAIVSALGSFSKNLRLDSTGRFQSTLLPNAAFDKSMEDFCVDFGCSKKLHDILIATGFWSGMPMDKCPAYILLYNLGALLVSAWELGCTGTQMVDAYVERARATGADLLLDDPVEQIIVRDGSACGVLLRSGRSLTCRKIIASIHPKLVLGLLPENAVDPEYRRGLMQLEETSGVVSVRLLVDASCQEALDYNLFRIHGVDGATIDGTFLLQRKSELEGYNVVTIFRGSAYRDWMKWAHTYSGNRGEDYVKAKTDIAESLIWTARSVMGDLGEYTILDITTPLTMRDWAACPEGGAYGILRSVKNDLQYSVLTRLPVRSLYLVGQSAIAPGLFGVTLSVLRGVGEVAGRKNFQQFLAGMLASKNN